MPSSRPTELPSWTSFGASSPPLPVDVLLPLTARFSGGLFALLEKVSLASASTQWFSMMPSARCLPSRSGPARRGAEPALHFARDWTQRLRHATATDLKLHVTGGSMQVSGTGQDECGSCGKKCNGGQVDPNSSCTRFVCLLTLSRVHKSTISWQHMMEAFLQQQVQQQTQQRQGARQTAGIERQSQQHQSNKRGFETLKRFREAKTSGKIGHGRS